jgi:hypothetical protein
LEAKQGLERRVPTTPSQLIPQIPERLPKAIPSGNHSFLAFPSCFCHPQRPCHVLVTSLPLLHQADLIILKEGFSLVVMFGVGTEMEENNFTEFL